MCGIAGSLKATATDDVRRMLECLHHRGPDGSGLDETPLGSLGHTRLAILDVTGGRQPIHYQDYTISFNGEIYNHAALRQRYLADVPAQTRTDTEVIVQLYARFGPRCVEQLDGMFALAIVGPDEFFLARDPIGIKPLYTAHRGDTLFFASEIKALAEVTDDIR